MTVMISYAREDLAAVLALAADLERAHVDVWVDRELTGGQVWWNAILAQIRSCDLFLVALSPDSLRSRACASELDYAVQLDRPLLPVMLRQVAVQLTPQVIADTQIVDYRTRSVDAAIALISVVAGRPAAPPLPTPLPPPPAAPISYMNAFREAVDASALSFKEQLHLVAELRVYLDDPADRDVAMELLRRLRGRPDIAESVGREVDQLLNLPVAPSSGGPSTERKATGSGELPRLKRDGPTASTSPGPPATTTAPVTPSRSTSNTAELPLPVRGIHLISVALVLLMVVVVWADVPAPAAPIIFFGAALAGFALSLVTIQRLRRHPDRIYLRRGAFVWAGLWTVLFLVVAVLFLTNL